MNASRDKVDCEGTLSANLCLQYHRLGSKFSGGCSIVCLGAKRHQGGILRDVARSLGELGQRSSISLRISSAQRTASEMAATVAGTRLPPSYCASLRAARILAAINKTRLRPSSTGISLSYSLFVRHENPQRDCPHPIQFRYA